MKTQIKTTIIGTTIALALAFLPATQAANQVKGAEKLESFKTVSDAAPAVAMKCGQCKSVAVENTHVEKGHIKTVTLAEKHVCPGCGNLSEMTGVGKAKKEVATHVCATGPGGASVCCAMK